MKKKMAPEDDDEPVPEQIHEDDAAVGPGDFDIGVMKKDRSKDNKFKALYTSGSLPEWASSEWNRIKSMKVGRTEAQRDLVNNYFTKNSSGSLVAATDNPMITSIKDKCL